MCGIALLIGKTENLKENIRNVVLDKHRGPDDSGFYLKKI